MASAGMAVGDGEPDRAAIERVRAKRDEWDARWLDDMRSLGAGIEVRNASSVKAEPRPLVADADSGGGADGQVDTGLAPPRDIGDALHRVLELVDLPDAVTLEAVAEAVCLEHGLGALTAEVVEMAHRCIASPPVSSAEVLHREVPFVRPLEGGDVLVGRIDAVAGDGTVMDFKTDVVEHGVVLDGAEHRGQLEAYRDAVAAARSAAPGDAWVVMARAGEAGRL